MKIKYLNFNTTNFKNVSQVETQNKRGNKNLSNIGYIARCIGLTYIGVGLISKSCFDKNILRKGLKMKDELLINKKTGEAFTGKIKSNVGMIIGFNKIETRVFENGVITEKTYKDVFGRELFGYFYKNGKLCIDVSVYKTFKKNKRFSYTWRKEDGNTCHFDGISDKSLFEHIRKIIKNK
jgi:hypothetical protein